MHRFVSVIVTFVVLIHATTGLAIMDLSQCERMTGHTIDSADQIDKAFENGTVTWNDPRHEAEICFWVCLEAMEPNSQWHENGTLNINVLEDRLREKQRQSNYSSVDKQNDIDEFNMWKECAKERGRDFCDSVAGISNCLERAIEDHYSTENTRPL